ncbi:MAG: hypothetical protein LBT29_05000 [Flavobacteriaceae bacterium]|jgi:hypothetical protein|nr:hypothetical protein [Flavobacteriaceae bacterium]
MKTTERKNKIQANFRLNRNLINTLKINAKNENRSLNNYVEVILSNAVFDVPNAETIRSIEDIETSRNISRIDDIDEFFNEFIYED